MNNPPPQATNEFKQQGYERRDVKGHTKRICTLDWCSSGRKLATGSQDTSIRIWSIDAYNPPSRHERCTEELRGHSGMVAHLAWKPDSEAVVASIAGDKNDKSLRLWDVKSQKATSVVSFSNAPLYVTWSPDGTTLAVLDQTNTLSIVDARKAKVVKPHKFNNEIFEIQWGPTPQHLLLATDKGSVDVLSVTTMETLWSLAGHTAYCSCFATAHDYKYLVTGGADALVALWDLDDAICVRTWAHMDGVLRSVSISYDNAYVAYVTDSRELEILGLRTGERIQELPVRGECDGVAWNPKHNVLAYVDEMLDPMARYDARVVAAPVCIFAPAREQ